LRLIAYLEDGKPAFAALKDDGLVRLADILTDAPTDLMSLLQAGDAAMADLEASLASAATTTAADLDSVTLCPPISRPGKIICLGLNYADHAAEGGHARPDYPSVFLRSSTSLVAHAAPMIRPACSNKFDYEAELAVIIGQRCRHVKAGDAAKVIAGYSCFNDGSIRDYQKRTPQWTIGKNFDATGAFGPAFVTADEVPDGAKGLRIQTRLNGTVMQDANTLDLLFPVAEAIAILSECMTLEPGDVIVTGTPSGVGAARTPPVWMKDGDTVEVEIEGVGILRNPIRDEG
jgi:2-keto-4-pentenoate hydratase/2-oxohepta-3-ene-1,7-dioic acid hydratase in catechol pathway